MKIGQSVRRAEDRRLLTGAGAYLDDLDATGLLHGVMLRSPHAHARIRRIDTAAAVALPGVRLVVTGADVRAAGLGPIQAVAAVTLTGQPLAVAAPPYAVLADGVARHVGDAVAFVVADDRDTALAACEAIDVAYEPLPAAVDPDDPAAEPGYAVQHGDAAATDAAFATAAHVVEIAVRNPRASAAPLETRSAIARPDGDRIVLTTGTQAPHLTRRLLAAVFQCSESALRIVTPDVGGGFGLKASTYREQALVVWAARRLGRGVKWQADRSESFLADTAGRDMHHRIALALDADGRVLGLRARVTSTLGAYLAYFGAVTASIGLAGLVGVYAIPAVDIRSRGVLTHTTPVDAYRGAGRPESIYAIERAMDAAARRLGLSGVALRRRNLIPAAALPAATPMTTVYDSGDFAAALDRAVGLADLDGFPARRAEAAARDRLRGIGVIGYIERCAAGAEEAAHVRLDAEGGADVMLGTMTAGQGHATAYTQMVADRLGLDPARIRIHQGDTDVVARGVGTFGSRSLPVGGSALHRAMDALIEVARPHAADALEAAAVDLEFRDGAFTIVGTDRSLRLSVLAQRLGALASPAPGAASAARMAGGLGADLAADGTFQPVQPTYPNGFHACEVEVDPETGETVLLRYVAVDDFGNEINPMMVDGQVHGGIAQGVGQALLEQLVHDATGQLVSGSFMDYAMPRAADMPDLVLARSPDPCRNNPLGVKGCGEAGATAAPPAVVNAILDALAPAGVTGLDMPATPERVWRALQAAAAR